MTGWLLDENHYFPFFSRVRSAPISILHFFIVFSLPSSSSLPLRYSVCVCTIELVAASTLVISRQIHAEFYTGVGTKQKNLFFPLALCLCPSPIWRRACRPSHAVVLFNCHHRLCVATRQWEILPLWRRTEATKPMRTTAKCTPAK